MIRYMIAATALSVLPVSATAAELIVNGSFEDPTITNSCCSTVPPASLPGWTVGSGNVNVVNGTFASSPTNTNLAFDGLQYLDLVGEGGVGSLSQTFNTVAGSLYTFSFAYSHNLFGGGASSASASFLVDSLGGTVTHNTGSNANLDWQSFSQNFTASGATTTLNFTNLTGAGSNQGILLDAVSIQSAVPEPGTWAMMMLGFGAIGGAMRHARRRKLNLSHA